MVRRAFTRNRLVALVLATGIAAGVAQGSFMLNVLSKDLLVQNGLSMANYSTTSPDLVVSSATIGGLFLNSFNSSTNVEQLGPDFYFGIDPELITQLSDWSFDCVVCDIVTFSHSVFYGNVDANSVNRLVVGFDGNITGASLFIEPVSVLTTVQTFEMNSSISIQSQTFNSTVTNMSGPFDQNVLDTAVFFGNDTITGDILVTNVIRMHVSGPFNFTSQNSFTIALGQSSSVVPEPHSVVLLLGGLCALGWLGRRARKADR